MWARSCCPHIWVPKFLIPRWSEVNHIGAGTYKITLSLSGCRSMCLHTSKANVGVTTENNWVSVLKSMDLVEPPFQVGGHCSRGENKQWLHHPAHEEQPGIPVAHLFGVYPGASPVEFSGNYLNVGQWELVCIWIFYYLQLSGIPMNQALVGLKIGTMLVGEAYYYLGVGLNTGAWLTELCPDGFWKVQTSINF